MSALRKIILVRIMVCFMAVGLMFPAGIANAKTIEERPSGLSMIADVVLIRPIMAVGTGIGAGVYVVTLPISLLGGNAKEAGHSLVVTPFKATFLRCLGCTNKHTQEYGE